MKLLPIEPGCRAIITRSRTSPDDIGKEVLVMAAQRKYPGHECPSCQSLLFWPVQVHGIIACCGCALMRIDGGDFSHERETGKVREKA